MRRLPITDEQRRDRKRSLDRARYARNRVAIRAIINQRNKQNRESIREYMRKWRAENRCRCKQYQRVYWQIHTDRIRRLKRLWKLVNREKVLAGHRLYYKTHADTFKAKSVLHHKGFNSRVPCWTDLVAVMVELMKLKREIRNGNRQPDRPTA